MIADHDRVRLDHFAELLTDWSERDLRRFATDLERFTQAYESANETWIADALASPQRGTN